MNRDPDEEFELFRRVVETTKRYLDSLEALDDSFKGFDINSIFRELLIRIDIYPVGTKHLSRYFGLPYDPLSLYVLAMTMQLLAIRHGVKTPSGNHGIYYSTKTRQYYLVGGSFDIESKRFDYITARLGREELAVSVREAIESLRGRPRWGEYIA